MSRAKITKEMRQGDEISGIVTTMILASELIAGIWLPSQLQKQRIQLLVVGNYLIARIVHQDELAASRSCASILRQSHYSVGTKVPHP